MAEDGRREPTVEDFRALLAAARLFDATTRGGYGRHSWSASDAAYTLHAIFRESGMESHRGAITHMMGTAIDAARELVEAIDDPLRRLQEDRDERRGGLQWPLGIAIEDPGERARILAAIDALAAATDLLEIIPRLTAETRTAVEEKLRAGRPPDDPVRNARIVAAYFDNKRKPAAIAEKERVSPDVVKGVIRREKERRRKTGRKGPE